MRKFVVVAVVFICASLATAQDNVHSAFYGQWKPLEIGAWGGYGNGVGKAGDWHFIEGGIRFGKVLTREVGNGFFRGNLELAVDAIPLYLVRQPEIVEFAPNQFGRTGKNTTIYGAGFNPFVVKWNFTRGKKIAPFAAINGGLLFTTEDMPQPDTSTVNFASGVEFGAHFFRTPRSAITVSGNVLHISNASLGNHNPGLNTTLHFRVAYTRFTGARAED